MDISANPGYVSHSTATARTNELTHQTHHHHHHAVCWKSILAGTVAALGVQLILTLIGAGIAAANVNPATEPGSMDTNTAGVMAAIWLVVSGIISFGIGGMVAGRASFGHGTHAPVETRQKEKRVNNMDGALHGALAWSLAAVLGVVATTIAGAAIGSAAGNAGAAATSRSSSWSAWSIPTAQSGWTFAGPSASAGGARMVDGRNIDEGITVVNPYGQRRTITETEARAMAESAASAASKATLATAFAFALAMIAATLGGLLGRQQAERCAVTA